MRFSQPTTLTWSYEKATHRLVGPEGTAPFRIKGGKAVAWSNKENLGALDNLDFTADELAGRDVDELGELRHGQELVYPDLGRLLLPQAILLLIAALMGAVACFAMAVHRARARSVRLERRRRTGGVSARRKRL